MFLLKKFDFCFVPFHFAAFNFTGIITTEMTLTLFGLIYFKGAILLYLVN